MVAGFLDESWYLDTPANQSREWFTARDIHDGQNARDAAVWFHNVDKPNANLVEQRANRAELQLRAD